MKTKLLFAFLFSSMLGLAQTPINTFYIDDNVSYFVVDTATELNHTTGASQVWNFDQLTEIGSSGYTNVAPTAGETSTYPGTTTVIAGDVNGNTTQMFTKNVSNTVSITGLLAIGLQLNFATNNATLGTFPLNYGFSNTDAVAGTYNYTTYSGTFTGNIVTTVDAYGTLTRNIGGMPTSNVTRLKTVITLTLNYSILVNVGTITQTTYSYYPEHVLGMFNGPLFRSSTTSALVPLASIDQTDTVNESFAAVLLGVENNVYDNQIQIVPNRIKDLLQIQNPSNQKITTIQVIDTNGRTVLTQNSFENPIDISALQDGIYLVNITTDKGTTTQKIIKE